MEDRKEYELDLDDVIENSLILDFSEYVECENSATKKYNSMLGEKGSIKDGFLRRFISNQKFFDYCLYIIEKREKELSIICQINGDFSCGVQINVSAALGLLEKYKYLSEVEEQRLNMLKNKASSIKSLLEDYKDVEYVVRIKEKEIKLNAKDALTIFFSNDSIAEKNLNSEYILGVSKYEFAYFINKLIQQEKIFQRYYLDEKFVYRYNALKHYRIVDFQSLEVLEVSEESIKYDIEISQELKKNILKGMNPNYNKLEKSIYIYIRLCKTFSYDPLFYINGQRGKVAEYHENIDRLKTITGKEDSIVCYEFNTIYGKFLDLIGVKYYINVRDSSRYGRNHANLSYIIDEYIVWADAMVSIMGGDLINAKINYDLNGLKCINKSKSTKSKFNRTLEKIYKHIIRKESISGNSEFEISTLLSIYRKLCSNKNNGKVSFARKAELLIEEINNSNLKDIDAVGYLIKLSRNLFSEKEFKNNYSCVVMKENDKPKEKVCVIITTNEVGFEKKKANVYMYYTPGSKIKQISENELEIMLKKKKLEYIDKTNYQIPGFPRLANKRRN